MRVWPKQVGRFPLTFLLVGSHGLADAVAECRPVRRIVLQAMELDGKGGTFAQVCRLVFGTLDDAAVERLHAASRGCMGPLLNIARLQGLEPPFCVPESAILRLPGPDAS